VKFIGIFHINFIVVNKSEDLKSIDLFYCKEIKMLKKPLRYRLADKGLLIGLLGSLSYAAVTADGEGANYISGFAKQLVSEPIIPISIGGFYAVGGLVDAAGGFVDFVKQKKIRKNLEQNLE
jgi:hypothetical protein